MGLWSLLFLGNQSIKGSRLPTTWWNHFVCCLHVCLAIFLHTLASPSPYHPLLSYIREVVSLWTLNTQTYSTFGTIPFLYYLLFVILLHIKNNFQKVLLCVLMHLIGQNDRVLCKRHGLSWKCIPQLQSPSHLWAGPAGHRARASRAHQYCGYRHIWAEQESCHHIHTLASCKMRGEVTSV